MKPDTSQGLQPDLFVSFESVAAKIGHEIAAGFLARIGSFPEREAMLGWRAGQMDSLPEDILWDGLGEESAPVFVVYKLIHEAYSNASLFFRAAMVEFMRAQPDRFEAVFNRETIWSAMAALPFVESPGACPSVAQIAKFLKQAQQRGIWWRSDEEIEREATAVHGTLTSGERTFQQGIVALQSLQLEKARGIAAGNLLLMVPGRLAAYADDVVSLGRGEQLPDLKEIHGRVDEFARDQESDARHVSIPLDLLYTTMDDDLLHVRILVRAKANPAERAEIRRRSIYLRYFLRKAFTGYQPDQLDLKLTFFLDSNSANLAWAGPDRLFHDLEWVDRKHFWNDICPGANPEELFGTIRQAATSALSKEGVVKKLKEHFARSRAGGRR